MQEELPGSPLANWAALDETVVARIVELNELQSGRAVARFGWRTWLGRLAASGARSYFVLDTLRRHSDRSRVLLERCQETTRRYLDEVPEARDVVHWDFSPDNVLAVGGAVTGVIDWDGTRGGDRLFDLATIVYYAPPAAVVREYVVERIGERALAVYLAHLCLRQAEWSLRRHDAETGEWMLAYALSVAAAAP